MKWFSQFIAVVVVAVLACTPALAQQKSEISITRQPGILYMPSHVMEKQPLIENEPDEVRGASAQGRHAQDDVYPPTDDQTGCDFAAWRAARRR